MAMTEVQCAHCGATVLKRNADINRANKLGASLYCDRFCAGAARHLRHFKTEATKKREKAEYDREYRMKNKERLRAQKAEYFQRTYCPEKNKIRVQERMPKHLEYCRRPEYRAKKREYDRRRRAHLGYGEYAEAYLLTLDLRRECVSQMDAEEIRQINQTNLKSQKRKRSNVR